MLRSGCTQAFCVIKKRKNTIRVFIARRKKRIDPIEWALNHFWHTWLLSLILISNKRAIFSWAHDTYFRMSLESAPKSALILRSDLFWTSIQLDLWLFHAIELLFLIAKRLMTALCQSFATASDAANPIRGSIFSYSHGIPLTIVQCKSHRI